MGREDIKIADRAACNMSLRAAARTHLGKYGVPNISGTRTKAAHVAEHTHLSASSTDLHAILGPAPIRLYL